MSRTSRIGALVPISPLSVDLCFMSSWLDGFGGFGGALNNTSTDSTSPLLETSGNAWCIPQAVPSPPMEQATDRTSDDSYIFVAGQVPQGSFRCAKAS